MTSSRTATLIYIAARFRVKGKAKTVLNQIKSKPFIVITTDHHQYYNFISLTYQIGVGKSSSAGAAMLLTSFINLHVTYSQRRKN
jgi:hypothetical protein